MKSFTPLLILVPILFMSWGVFLGIRDNYRREETLNNLKLQVEYLKKQTELLEFQSQYYRERIKN